jgi:anti-sigma factor RsiW
MSRDRHPPKASEGNERSAGSAAQDAAADPERSAELLSAYVDGVAELPTDQRRAVERWLADDPGARAEADAVHGLLGRLRALPPVYDRGEPPDWAAMERSIRQAVADAPTRPWWRSWRWLAPAMTCAAAAVVATALWPRLVQLPATDSVALPRPAEPAMGPEAPGNDPIALWLDGSEVVDRMLGQPFGDALLGSAEDAARAPVDETGVLPPAGMAWVDDLDDAALDRAERLLASPPSGAPATPATPATPARSKG